MEEKDNKQLTLEAKEGNAEAQYQLGCRYFRGKGISQNHEEAAEWYRKAADQGYPLMQQDLGFCYLGFFYQKGCGVPKDYSKAVEYFQLAAIEGDAAGQYLLGGCYFQAKGVPKDYSKAVEYFQLAADQGSAAAQTNLGDCYWNGLGVERDYKKAVEYFQLAADQGSAVAQTNLGFCYWNGLGVEQNYAQAVKYFQLAADQGDAAAQTKVGDCYYSGQGVEENYAQAVKYFQLAADQGFPEAQTNLGRCYHAGHGVPRDIPEAIKWYEKALAQGDECAKASLPRAVMQYKLDLFVSNNSAPEEKILENAVGNMKQAAEEKPAKPIKESSKKERPPKTKTTTATKKSSKSWDTEIKDFLDKLPNKDSSPIANVALTPEGLRIELNRRAQAQTDYRTLVQQLRVEYQNYFVLFGGVTSPNSVVLLTKKIKGEADVEAIKSIFRFEPKKKKNNPPIIDVKPAEPEGFYSPITITEKRVKQRISKKPPPSNTFFSNDKSKETKQPSSHTPQAKKSHTKPNAKKTTKSIPPIAKNTAKIHPPAPEKGKALTLPPPRGLPKRPTASLEELAIVKNHEPDITYTMALPEASSSSTNQALYFYYYKASSPGQTETPKKMTLPVSLNFEAVMKLSAKVQDEVNHLNQSRIVKQALLYDFFFLLELTKEIFNGIEDIEDILPLSNFTQLRESMKSLVFNHRKQNVHLENLMAGAEKICQRLQDLNEALQAPKHETHRFEPLKLITGNLQTDDYPVRPQYHAAFFKDMESRPVSEMQFIDLVAYVEEFLQYLKMIEDDTKSPEEKAIALSAAKWCVIGLDGKQKLFEKHMGKTDDLNDVFLKIHVERNRLAHIETYKGSHILRNQIMDVDEESRLLLEFKEDAIVKMQKLAALSVDQENLLSTIRRE